MADPTASASGSDSEFQSFIPSVPWQTGFFLGAGVNASTGAVKPSAVLPFQFPPNETKQSREFCRTIRYESNLVHELSAAAGGGITLNIGQIGLGAEAAASLLSHVKVSATSSTILATYTTTYDFDLASDYQLRPDMAELARDNLEEFRRRFGDYFVAGGQKTSTFTALLVYSSSNLETLDQFSSKLSGSLNDLFKAFGSIERKKEAENVKLDTKVFVEMRGYHGSDPPGAPWDAEKVENALAWFKLHEVGEYNNARLQHYSTLDPSIPVTMPVSWEIFNNISRLHVLLQSISILSGSCPDTQDSESSELVSRSNEVRKEVYVRQGALAVNSAMCTKYLERAEELHATLSTLHKRYSFWVQILNQVPDQPDNRIEATKNIRTWAYGFTSTVHPADPKVEILSTEHSVSLPWTFSPFARDGKLEYVGDQRMIVGWKVISVRDDGHNGSWRRLSSSVLLSHGARIIFRTKPFRSAVWKLVVYHVDQRLYSFPQPGMGGGYRSNARFPHAPRGDSDQASPPVGPPMGGQPLPTS